jgi:hypothetical protein
LVAINSTFIELWTGGRVVWSSQNDLACAGWLVLGALSYAWNMLPAITKRLGPMKYVYLGEGLLVLSPGLISAPVPGLFWVPWIMVCCLLVGRLAHGLLRLRQDLAMPLKAAVGRLAGVMFLVIVLVGIAWVVLWLCRSFDPRLRLVMLSGAYGFLALPVALGLGVPGSVRAQLLDRVFFRKQ